MPLLASQVVRRLLGLASCHDPWMEATHWPSGLKAIGPSLCPTSGRIVSTSLPSATVHIRNTGPLSQPQAATRPLSALIAISCEHDAA